MKYGPADHSMVEKLPAVTVPPPMERFINPKAVVVVVCVSVYTMLPVGLPCRSDISIPTGWPANRSPLPLRAAAW